MNKQESLSLAGKKVDHHCAKRKGMEKQVYLMHVYMHLRVHYTICYYV